MNFRRTRRMAMFYNLEHTHGCFQASLSNSTLAGFEDFKVPNDKNNVSRKEAVHRRHFFPEYLQLLSYLPRPKQKDSY
ncbi:hypothetical protein A0J61_01005 [Choanephora cucurbitarum]|uniref:Uncharacterized protein n=1 Tax=Choanephora cucurbitarum TaxID=101091 RepID=A0A1C7NPN3_9FUNG|nr:hypothetical protein A0J61_01005 [Choanephora cucurbitarum]